MKQTYLNSSRFQKDQKFWLEEFKTLPSVTGLKPYNTYQASTKASRENVYINRAFEEIEKNFLKITKLVCTFLLRFLVVHVSVDLIA